MSQLKRTYGPHTGLDESQTIELKETWVEDAMADLCAFANTDGGVVYIGVNKPGYVVAGTDVSDDRQQLIAGKIRNHLGVHADIRVEELEGHMYLAIHVQTVPGRPVLLRGKAYRRSGTSTFDVLPEEWGSFALARTNQTWDGLPTDASVEKDIDAEKVRAFIRSAQSRAKPRLSEDFRADAPVEVALETLGLLRDGRPTNACLLLFGREPQKFCRHARVRAFYFRGISDFDAFDDITGTLAEQIAEAVRVVSLANPVRVSFPDDGSHGVDSVDRTKRREESGYPELALKEAITNAIIHRDYSTPGSDVEIKMYPDRLVITNPGALMPGLTTDDLKRDPHPSRRRNPSLAEIAVLDHWIERAGTGTTRMIDLCREAGLPEPEFDSRPSGFTVTFRHVLWTRDALTRAGLNERQVEGVLHVRRTGQIGVSEYQNVANISKRTAVRDLRDLSERGVLEKRGAGAGTHYVLGEVPRVS